MLLADEINLEASHTRDVDAHATGGALATVGAGLSDARIVLDGTIQAGTGTGVRFGQIDSTGVVGRIGSLTVNATSRVVNSTTNANAVAGGVLAGNAAISRSTVNPTVRAALGAATEVYARGAVQVSAKTDVDADANAYGLAVAVYASAGASVATARINPSLYSGVGGNAIVEASGIVFESLHNVSQAGVPTLGEAQVKTTASGGAALIGLTGGLATADNAAQVLTEIGAATLTATTGNIALRSRSHNQADADATGLTVGFAGIGAQAANADVTTRNTLSILADATIESRRGDVTLLADSSENAEATATAGSGGVIAVSDGTADVDVNHTTTINVGDGALIEAHGTLSIDSKLSSFLRSDANANSGGGVAIPTSKSAHRRDRTRFEGGRIDPRRGRHPAGRHGHSRSASVQDGCARRRQLERCRARFRLRRHSHDQCDDHRRCDPRQQQCRRGPVRSKSGRRAPQPEHSHVFRMRPPIFAAAICRVSTSQLYGNSDSTATTNVTTDSKVTTQDTAGMVAASRITTQVLNVRSDAPVSPAINATATSDQAYFLFIDVDGGRASATESADIDRTIDFNSDVFIVNVSPILEIDSDGSILTQEGITFTDDGSDHTIADGTRMTIDPISNAGSLNGEINFTIGAVNVDGASSQAATLSTITGNPSLTYQTGFHRVTISVAAPLDVELQDIDVINRSVSPNAVITKSNVESDTLMVTSTISTGETKLDVTGAQKLTVAGVVDNAFGITTMTAGSDILTATTADLVETKTLILLAPHGDIGDPTQSFQTKTSQDADASAITSTRVTAQALDHIYLNHLAGDLAAAGIISDCGVAHLVSAGGLLDGSGEDGLADIEAITILLDANGGGIGTTGVNGDGIEINTLASNLALDAEATGSIHLVELTDALPVVRVRSTTGDIELTVTDADDLGQDLLLSRGEIIQADLGSVRLRVGDNFSLAVGATLSAGTTITVLLDQDGLDLLRGSSANFLGTLTPTTGFSVAGGDDDECILLAALGADVPVSIQGAEWKRLDRSLVQYTDN